jgi:hypothetical protein
MPVRVSLLTFAILELPLVPVVVFRLGTAAERIGHFMQRECVYCDVPLKVVEFPEEPSDVILHSSGLHGFSANISGTLNAARNIRCLRA